MPSTQQRLTGPGPLFTQEDIPAFQDLVLSRYRSSGRKFPWRETTDPYAIFVSEIMLQQTQVGRVAEKFPQFMAAFPDFSALATAPLADLLSQWQGMGYNRRAIALQKCARRVMEEFHGVLPNDPEILATFPGIGKATASSICAFAFNRPVVFIETNIRRIFIHCFFPDNDIIDDSTIRPLVEAALYRENPREWYNALMDYGTELKKAVPNPNRRSVHYSRQPAFEGSDRKIRGEIVRQLLSGKKLTEKALVSQVGGDPDRVGRILGALEAEGFIKRYGRSFSIADKTA
ncbi:HhH-GPD family protein [Methanoregula formicica]|uniref:A/G-specific DNA glycosylase n=1 Tax=Methanoregula formicica (strain DSM 22288 / NBRC 105244 / SMSP) TaxID=593750 RepID=L0HGP5_METFS|nr:A/G-specific adenine glycosylase [Methanoregula formicica]AGB02503.1 A/G-specific DNA glycosylase [Methanoregula formicica SMSP]